MIDPDLSIAELGRRLRRGEATSRQITAAALARIDDLDGGIHAFIRVESNAAIVAATMSTHSGAINSLAGATTHDIYLPLSGRSADDPHEQMPR